MSRERCRDVLIVDANNIAARCWQARAFGASEPPPPGEVALTAYRMIQKQAEGLHVEPSAISIAFDAGDSGRATIFPGYKAERRARDSGLDETLDILDEKCFRAGYQCYISAGYEADDVIATLTRKHLHLGHGVTLYSNDGDLLQLLQPGVLVVQPLPKGEFREWTVESFEAAYGFAPPLLAHYKALRGDKSDGLPQVPKLGEAWGKRLIAAYGDIDRLYEGLKTLPPESLSTLQKAILDCEFQVRQNLVLSTLQEVPGL